MRRGSTIPILRSARDTLTQKGVIEDGMAQMSEKFKALGEQVYVDAEKVKESNKVL